MRISIRTKRSQFTTEYLIIIAIAIAIIALFLVYVFIYYTNYTNNANAQAVTTIVDAITSHANYVLATGGGSESAFPLVFPALNITGSYFCGSYIRAATGSTSAVAAATANIVGLLPTKPGNYLVYAKYQNGSFVEIGIESALAYINYSYSVSGSKLYYNLSFQNQSGSLVPGVPFNISIYSASYKYINSTIGGGGAGTVSGSLHLPATYPSYLVYVLSSRYSEIAASCLT